ANPDNWRAHYETTGPEIWADSNRQVTHFVSAMGTTGTIMGVSRFLKEQRKEITIVGCQPADGASIPGIRRWPKEYLPTIYAAEDIRGRTGLAHRPRGRGRRGSDDAVARAGRGDLLRHELRRRGVGGADDRARAGGGGQRRDDRLHHL